MFQRFGQPIDLVHHAAGGAHGPGATAMPPSAPPAAGAARAESAVDIVLPAEPLLNGVCHAHDGEGGHLVGREPVLRAVLVKATGYRRPPCPAPAPSAQTACATACKTGRPSARHSPHQLTQARTFAGRGSNLTKIHKRIAIHAVQQAQQAHIARLLPHGERTGHPTRWCRKVPALCQSCLHCGPARWAARAPVQGRGPATRHPAGLGAANRSGSKVWNGMGMVVLSPIGVEWRAHAARCCAPSMARTHRSHAVKPLPEQNGWNRSCFA